MSQDMPEREGYWYVCGTVLLLVLMVVCAGWHGCNNAVIEHCISITKSVATCRDLP